MREYFKSTVIPWVDSGRVLVDFIGHVGERIFIIVLPTKKHLHVLAFASGQVVICNPEYKLIFSA
jgi:hypothetical protein